MKRPLRKLEPARGILHGAGQSPEAFQDYCRCVGPEVQPLIYMTYCGIRADMPAYFARLKAQLDAYGDTLIPQIGLGMTTDGTPEDHHEHLVAEGHYDHAIAAFCAGLKTLSRPAFVRVGFEFNGRWNGYQPGTYIQAWRRIATAIREHGLDNVATVWCYASDIRNLPNLMDWYPGDEWVDWWGIDLFLNEHFWLADTEKFMSLSIQHGFPVMIGESAPRAIGVLDGETSWQRWFAPYFGFMRRWKNVKAFCYIAWDWAAYPKYHDWGDGRLWRNDVVAQHWRETLADPVFIHRNSAARIRRRLRCAPGKRLNRCPNTDDQVSRTGLSRVR